MTSGFDPPGALAMLAATVDLWKRKRHPVDQWLIEAERQMEQDPPRPRPAWQLTLADLAAATASALKLCDRRVLPNESRMLEAVRAVNLLDDWHEPLDLLDVGALPPTIDHVQVQLRLGGGKAYNENETWGLIIPRGCPSPGASAVRKRSRLPNSILHATTYVPPLLEAGDANDPELASLGRMVSVRYLPPRLRDRRPDRKAEPAITVAPVHQGSADAKIVAFDDPARYGIEVGDSGKRLPRIIEAAMANDSELLFLPEMALDEGQIPELASLLKRSAAEFDGRHGREPVLRYVVAGCVSRPVPAGFGRNFIIVMDLEGSIILKQGKLTRWNLKPHHQYCYGLRDDQDSDGHEILENIEEGNAIWVADLHGLGRFITLICADLSYNEPGDFLIRNLDVDWLHAPIMDKTNNVAPSSVADQPWTVKRAYRAATEGARRVIVTNSVLFTTLVNQINSRPGSKFAPFAQCSIAFLLDCTHSKLHYRDLSITMPPTDTVVCSARWSDKFAPFPPRSR